MDSKNLAKEITAVAAGIGTTMCVSNIITSMTNANTKMPIKVAAIVGAFVVGTIVLDATRYGVDSQISGIAAMFKNRKKN